MPNWRQFGLSLKPYKLPNICFTFEVLTLPLWDMDLSFESLHKAAWALLRGCATSTGLGLECTFKKSKEGTYVAHS